MFIYVIFIAGFFVVIDGSQNINFRIAGGNIASILDRPYIVSIQHDNFLHKHSCTGSIVSEDIILTAGHCIPDNFHELKIRSSSNFSMLNGNIHAVDSFIRHENYNLTRYSTYDEVINDIALIKVRSPFVFNDTFRPIPMFDAGEKIPSGSNGIVSGWGRIPEHEKNKSSYANQRYNPLRSVVVRVLDHSVCKKELEKKFTTLSPGEMCAGGAGDGKGTCAGDSGGPLVVNGKLAGVVSWGYGCGELGFAPSVLSEVAYFRKWIDENMSKLSKRN